MKGTTKWVELTCPICGNKYYRPAGYDYAYGHPKTCGKGNCPAEMMSRTQKERYGTGRQAG
jgi:hypothetical protein